MEAYDLKVLVAKGKEVGLELTEDGAKKFAGLLFDWAEESIKASATLYDDMALGAVLSLKKIVLEAADKIDGKVG